MNKIIFFLVTYFIFLDGKAYCDDGYAEDYYQPIGDSLQNVEVISGSEINGITTVIMSRKLNTGDIQDFIIPIGIS